MTTGPVRRGLHVAHAATVLVLVVTGLLILWPELRSRTLGGYGVETGRVHLYLGLAFAIAPVLAWLLAPRGLLADLWEQIDPRDLRSRWRRTHIVVSLVSSAALTLSGLVLWLGVDLPVKLWDATADVHVVGHWILTLSLPVHLVVSRRKITQRVRLMLGGEPPELFEFADDIPDDIDEINEEAGRESSPK